MIDWFNSNSGFATSLAAMLSFTATLALIGITALYTRHTRRLVEGSNEPSIQPWLYPRGPTVLFLRVVNAGTGPALDVEFELTFSSSAATKRWYWPFIPVGGMYDFLFVADSGDAVFYLDQIESLGHMKFYAKCKSVDNRTIITERSIDIKGAIMSARDARMLSTDDHPDRIMISIRDEIKRLGEAVQQATYQLEEVLNRYTFNDVEHE